MSAWTTSSDVVIRDIFTLFWLLDHLWYRRGFTEFRPIACLDLWLENTEVVQVITVIETG